jgi:hypothetical protein
MMDVLRALRKLVLGETVALPVGIALAVGAAAALRVLAGAGGWWQDAGGAVLAALLVVALGIALGARKR